MFWMSRIFEHEQKSCLNTYDLLSPGFINELKWIHLSLMWKGATCTFKEVTSPNKRLKRRQKSKSCLYVCWFSRDNIKWETLIFRRINTILLIHTYIHTHTHTHTHTHIYIYILKCHLTPECCVFLYINNDMSTINWCRKETNCYIKIHQISRNEMFPEYHTTVHRITNYLFKYRYQKHNNQFHHNVLFARLI